MLFAPKTCIPSIEPSNSGRGPAGFLSRICPHRKFHSRLETTDADSPASALPCPVGVRRSAHYFSPQEGLEIQGRNTLRLAYFHSTGGSNRRRQSQHAAVLLERGAVRQ